MSVATASKTFAGVVRVSDMHGRKSDSDSFHSGRDQVEAIQAAVPAGARLDLLPPELDVSGGVPLEQRPALFRALEGVEDGTYAGVVLAYQSRLFRHVEEEEAFWRRIEAAGGQVLLALDPVDNSTVDGRMVRRIKSATNAAERERHADQFDRRRRVATEAGIWQRRQTPTGYRKDPATRRLVPDHRADDVRSAFRERAAGASATDLGGRLGMTPSGVRHLLRNRVYLGVLKVGKYVNEAAHEALVSAEEFEAAQQAQARPPRSTRPPALLAGLVRCAACGHVMSRARGKSETYRCPAYHSGERCPAPAQVTVGLLDGHVESIALRELERLSVTARDGRDTDRTRLALEDAERELAAYLDAVSAAELGAETFAAGARKRSDDVDRAREELRAELARRPAIPMAATGADVWGSLDAQERNTVLRGLLAAVVVRRAGGRGARVPLTNRVRVFKFGADLALPARGGGAPGGIVPIELPDLDDPRVLRVASGENLT
jgi:DNA invertase Pin-like site-specific DNA recombinase